MQEGYQAVQNAGRQRFETLTSPQLLEYYSWQAAQVGLKFHPDQRLLPLIQTVQGEILYDTKSNPDEPIMLNRDVPKATIKLYCDDPTFIRKVSCCVNGYEYREAAACGVENLPPAPFEPQALTNWPMPGLNILDHIYIQVSRAGSNQVFTEHPVSLSSFCGTGPVPYFWTPIPIVKRSGWLEFILSINPPGQDNWPDGPPFVKKIGFIQLQFHTEVFQPFGY